MKKTFLQNATAKLRPFWKLLSDAEDFTRNRRNLYAISAAFVLVIVGGGQINQDASFFGGTIMFERRWVLYATAFVLLVYAWWKFEMTMPVQLSDLWEAERREIWKRTDSFIHMMQDVLSPGHAIVDDDPIVKGKWLDKTIHYSRCIVDGNPIQNGHFGGESQ